MACFSAKRATVIWCLNCAWITQSTSQGVLGGQDSGAMNMAGVECRRRFRGRRGSYVCVMLDVSWSFLGASGMSICTRTRNNTSCDLQSDITALHFLLEIVEVVPGHRNERRWLESPSGHLSLMSDSVSGAGLRSVRQVAKRAGSLQSKSHF